MAFAVRLHVTGCSLRETTEILQLSAWNARIRTRLGGTEDLLAVMEALQRADPEEGPANRLRLILKGMYNKERVPEQHVIEQSLNLLAHPSNQLAEYKDGQYQPTTTKENAEVLLRRFGNLITEVSKSGEK